MIKRMRMLRSWYTVAAIILTGSFFSSCLKKSEVVTYPVVTYPISVQTFAGNIFGGFADGTGVAASFYMPSVLTMDAAGNMYVSDTGNGLIRKINQSGDVKTIAGSPGNHDSLLGFPYGLAVDAKGNIYVGDVERSRILKVNPAGSVSIFAGNGSAGLVDGPAETASFNGPYGLAVDVQGNVYVADAGNNAIRKITPAGYVSTFAGNGNAGSLNGKGTEASFFSPYGVTIDVKGNLIIADTYNQLIRKITPDGTVSTVAGGGLSDSDTPGHFGGPYSVAIDAAGNYYVADFSDNQIKMVSTSGAVTLLAGSGLKGYGNGENTTASFNGPSGIAVDASGDIFVADYRNNLIRVINIKK